MTTSRHIQRSGYTTGGITGPNRRSLTRLHADAKGPFTAADTAKLLSLEIHRARRLLSYLYTRGWLSRVRRGLYSTVPLEARRPAEWTEEPWLVASTAFRPCYIAGWSALEHWALTDQIFSAVAVVTTRRVRNRQVEIQGTSFVIRTRPRKRLFGTSKAWVRGVPVQVSDPTQTIVDVLDDPALGGGIKHVAEALGAYLESEHRNDDLLLNYAARGGNRAVYKRLGYLLEALGIEAPGLVEACRGRKSAGLAVLDPSVATAGRIVRRWNLRANASIRSAT